MTSILLFQVSVIESCDWTQSKNPSSSSQTQTSKINQTKYSSVSCINWFDHREIDQVIKNEANKTDNQLFDIINKMVNQENFDVNQKDKLGRNALHFLCENYSKENLTDVIQLLIEKGIDINSYDKTGDNALGYVFRNANQEVAVKVIKLLFRQGILFRHQHEAEKYYNIFEKGGNSGIEVLRYYANEDITLGWHQDCSSCNAIL